MDAARSQRQLAQPVFQLYSLATATAIAHKITLATMADAALSSNSKVVHKVNNPSANAPAIKYAHQEQAAIQEHAVHQVTILPLSFFSKVRL